jgi:hypothetical protein
MTLIVQLPNPIPYSFNSGLATKIQGATLPEPSEQPVNDYCYCEIQCDYVEKVFADPVSNDYWKNDKNTFMYRRLLNTDTVTINLLKNGLPVATIIDNTYGQFINGYPAGNSEQQLYVVFIIDWQKVLNLLGGGNYQISTDLVIIGVPSTQESQKFRLIQYSDVAANGTVRIETYQNGNIIGNPFDFTGLNLYNSYRIPGKFTETAPKLESDRYLNNDYKLNQIQDSVIPQYLLKTRTVPRTISLMLTRNSILANEFLVTDYNIVNEDIFRRVSVYPEGIEKPEIGNTTRPVYQIPFTDKYENLRKRNN